MHRFDVDFLARSEVDLLFQNGKKFSFFFPFVLFHHSSHLTCCGPSSPQRQRRQRATAHCRVLHRINPTPSILDTTRWPIVTRPTFTTTPLSLHAMPHPVEVFIPHPPTTTTSSCTATPPPALPATYGCCKNCRSRSTTRSPPFLATTTTNSTPIEKCRSSKSPPRTTTTTNTPSPCTKAWPSMCTCCGGTRLGLPWHPPPPKNGRNCTNGACGP